jgi:hypothetical protein
MLRHHSILIGPGRFPSGDGAQLRPGCPKPRVRTSQVYASSSHRQETSR